MQTFALAPIAAKPMGWSLAVLGLVGLGAVLALGLVWMLRSPPEVEIGTEGLRIRSLLFGRTIPLERIDRAGARPVDLAATPELAPKWRTLGVGLPGYKAGWFRLRNGDTALLFLTQPTGVVYVPTREDYAVMLTPTDPAAFLGALQAAGR